eukprot:scaffold24656_cov181-Cylindrotheca_fusiformis.AAC.4
MSVFAIVDDPSGGKLLNESEQDYLSTIEAVEERKDDGNFVKEFDLLEESKSLLGIALPAVAVQFSVLFIFPQTASVVGRALGKEELAGFSLGSLVGNLTCLSVMVGALTAADTLMPRAYAAGNFVELGRLAIRGFVLCSLLLVPPVVPLFTIMEWIFDKLGQDEKASSLASQWIKVYLLGVPAMLLFRVVQSFLNAQHKVWPMVYASLISCFLVHPIFLKVFVSNFELIGSSIAICLTQYVMVILLLMYLWWHPVQEKNSWPGLSRDYLLDSLSPQPVITFLSLSMGGVLSLTYQLVPLLFMIPLGIMIGLTVRLGHLIAFDVKRAKQLAAWCMFFSTIVGGVVTGLLYQFRIEIAMLFTSDQEVIEGCQAIWPKLCYYIFVLYIFGINSAILRALGMQWHMAAILFGCLWVGTLPAIFFFSVHRNGGINAVWTILPIFYTILQALLVYSYTTADWQRISKEVRAQAEESVEAAKVGNTEETGLLSKRKNMYVINS